MILQDDKQPKSTPVESNKDEDEAMAEEKDAPETKEVKASSEEVVLNSKQKKAEKKRRKKASKSAAMEEDAPYDFKVDYKSKQSNAMDVGEDEDDNEECEKPETTVEADQGEATK